MQQMRMPCPELLALNCVAYRLAAGELRNVGGQQ
jgi:hypothetical protein